MNALGIRRPVEVSQNAPTECPQHYDLARPRPLVSSRSVKQMNSENWKEIELNYCGTQVKGIYKISGCCVWEQHQNSADRYFAR
jgi:hypothetical protein